MTPIPKSLGLSQVALARRLNVRTATISDNATGRPGKVNPMWPALMEALEIMTPEQRAAWLERRKPDLPTVLLHTDEDGSATLLVTGDPVTAIWIDERAPADRVYRLTERVEPAEIAEIIGENEVGHAGDERYPNLAQAIAARGHKLTLV